MKEMGLMQHLVFKGGTMLRKMVFGPGGRLSTDLDFTVRSREAIAPDDLALEIAGVFSDPYRGIRFEFDVNKGLGVTAGSCRANPKCMTNFTPKGHVIKIEVSYRADPVLTPLETLQIAQPYFKDLDFEPGHTSLACAWKRRSRRRSARRSNAAKSATCTTYSSSARPSSIRISCDVSPS